MRVAISFSGLPRIKPQALAAWQRMISQHDCHVYMHVWNTDIEEISVLLQRLKPVACSIEPPIVFDVSCYTERLQESNPQSVFSMWTSISRSMSLVESSCIQYDRVVRARFDVGFDDFDFLDTSGIVIPGKPAEIYSWQGKRYCGWHDMMAYGDMSSMKQYANTLHAIPRIYQQSSPFFSEFFLSTHLFETQTSVTHHSVWADIIR